MPIVETRGSFTISRNNPEEIKMKVKNPVYLNADKTKAFPFGHPEAARLLVGTNGHISAETAKKYGITEDGAPGQKGDTSTRAKIPHAVNPSARDGINTHPESAANNPALKKAAEPEDKSQEAPAAARKDPPPLPWKPKASKTPAKKSKAKKTGKR